jgi:hypothetical protein
LKKIEKIVMHRKLGEDSKSNSTAKIKKWIVQGGINFKKVSLRSNQTQASIIHPLNTQSSPLSNKPTLTTPAIKQLS